MYVLHRPAPTCPKVTRTMPKYNGVLNHPDERQRRLTNGATSMQDATERPPT